MSLQLYQTGKYKVFNVKNKEDTLVSVYKYVRLFIAHDYLTSDVHIHKYYLIFKAMI